MNKSSLSSKLSNDRKSVFDVGKLQERMNQLAASEVAKDKNQWMSKAERDFWKDLEEFWFSYNSKPIEISVCDE